MPIGLGSHIQWDKKIDGRIAQALMSINAVKDVSIGPGWEVVNKRGSEVHDVIEPVTDPDNPWQRKTNRAGGTEGGMTDGMPLVARFGIKPIATLHNPLPSVDLDTGEPVQAHFERSDVCQAPSGRGHRRGHGGPGPGRRLHGKVRRRLHPRNPPQLRRVHEDGRAEDGLQVGESRFTKQKRRGNGVSRRG